MDDRPMNELARLVAALLPPDPRATERLDDLFVWVGDGVFADGDPAGRLVIDAGAIDRTGEAFRAGTTPTPQRHPMTWASLQDRPGVLLAAAKTPLVDALALLATLPAAYCYRAACEAKQVAEQFTAYRESGRWEHSPDLWFGAGPSIFCNHGPMPNHPDPARRFWPSPEEGRRRLEADPTGKIWPRLDAETLAAQLVWVRQGHLRPLTTTRLSGAGPHVLVEPHAPGAYHALVNPAYWRSLPERVQAEVVALFETRTSIVGFPDEHRDVFGDRPVQLIGDPAACYLEVPFERIIVGMLWAAHVAARRRAEEAGGTGANEGATS